MNQNSLPKNLNENVLSKIIVSIKTSSWLIKEKAFHNY
jgi:hypothetical protein